MPRIYTLLVVLFFAGNLFSQKVDVQKKANRKTIGLVLSGGGAKGFAHIGAIQLLEECGIKPDFITGTSMGSIVGALYAMGYTVDEMKQVSDTTNWTLVLSNTVPLTEVAVVEKPYYGTFLVDMDVSLKGISLPGGLIEGQNLMEKLSVLSRPVHGIESFLDFPIPYTCVATDIVKGIPVALNHGNITDAIRASMAIPTAFTPVEIDSNLYIDGGWTRNLPVTEAKDMGADIIIAVNVGALLKEKDELQSMVSILDQTAWLLSAKDTEEQLKLCDYVITPPVSGFSTFAFDEADTIIAEGYKEAEKQRQVFEDLAKSIYPEGKNTKEIIKPFYGSDYQVSNIVTSGTKLTSSKFVKGRLAINPNKKYTAEQIAKKIGLLYGTLYYQKVNFELIQLADSTHELRVKVVENNPSKLKLSLYYDTENSVGFNLNLTLRNLVFKNSRLILDGFIAENPILGLKYLKYAGPNQNSFYFLDFKYTKDSRFDWINAYDEPSRYNYRDFTANAGVAHTFNHSTLIGLSIGFQGAKMTPISNPDSIISTLTESSVPLRAIVTSNTLDSPVFPTKGTMFLIDAEYKLNVDQKLNLKAGYPDSIQNILNESYAVDPFFIFRIGIQHYMPVVKKFSLYGDAEMVMPSKEKIGFNDMSKIGGIAPILNSASPFWGLRSSQIITTRFAAAAVGFQWNFYSSLYLKGKVDYLNTKYPMDWIYPMSNSSNNTFSIEDKHGLTSMFGFGAELAYNSAFGPVRLVLHQNQYSNQLDVFVGIGFNIYKSYGDF